MSKSLRHFTALVGTATFSKLLFNIARRIVYPFAPELARDLGVELSAVTSVIAVNQATSLLGPLGAGFADRYGYKILMLMSLSMLTAGCMAVGLFPLYSVLIICLFLAGLAKAFFDPSLQAFISRIVPYEQRGRIIGITELSWAGATLLGIPAAGLIIERFSWQTPFLIIGGLSFICALIIYKLIPKDRPPQTSLSEKPPMIHSWKIILREKQVVGMLSYVFFISLANDNLFVIYGAWLESDYHLSLAAIGFGTIFIGISEALGEGGTVLFSDRIGLKKSVLLGTGICSLTYFLLPLLNTGLVQVLAGLFLVFFTFEFTMVTSMSLTTELVPELRASTMAAFFATAGVGRVIGAFSGGFIWSGYQLTGICIVSGMATFLAFVSLVWGLKKNT